MSLGRLSVFFGGVALLFIFSAAFAETPSTLSVGFSSDQETIVNEIGGLAELTVIRNGSVSNSFNVDYIAESGTATSGTDFEAIRGTLQFAEGEMFKNLLLPVVDDNDPEGDETLQVRLLNPTAGAILGATSTATVRIFDNDLPGGVDPAFYPRPTGPVSFIAKQSDGSIVANAGKSDLHSLTRFRPDGTRDANFITPLFYYVDGFVIDSRNRIVFISGGRLPFPAVVGRLNADGSLDSHFTTNSLGTSTENILLLPDDSILVATYYSLTHVAPNGEMTALPLTFRSPWPTGGIRALALTEDGKILVAGDFTIINGMPFNGIVRIDPLGNIDPTFVPPEIPPVDEAFWCLAVQPDGKIVAGGEFILPGSRTEYHLIRLNPNGEVDANFPNSHVVQTSWEPFEFPGISQIIRQTDGKLIVRGNFNKIQGENHLAIARLNGDGTIDSSFNALPFNVPSYSSLFTTMLLDEQRGLVLGGGFTTIDRSGRAYLARLNIEPRAAATRQLQSISFARIPDQTFGPKTITLSASSSSQLPVQFRIVSGTGDLNGNQLRLTGTGQVVLEAAQYGNDSYEPAPQITQSFIVGKASQIVEFAPVVGLKYLDAPVTLTASASSGLPVTFQKISGPGFVRLNTNLFVPTGAGIVTLRVTQTGDDRYEPASAEQTFTVGKAAQAITFNPTNRVFVSQGTLSLVGAASSGLPVSFTLLSGLATLDGSTLSFMSSGTITVRASQEGNQNFEAAENIEAIIEVVREQQSIDFPPLRDSILANPPLRLVATASSGLPVSFEIVSGAGSLNEDILTVLAAGSITIRATQGGNNAFEPAPYVERTLAVSAKRPQTLSFAPIMNTVFGSGSPVELEASASSGLPVTFTVVEGKAFIEGTTLTITGAGQITVRATQPGDEIYDAAIGISQSFEVEKASQTIDFAPPSYTRAGSLLALSGSATSHLPISFSVVSGEASIQESILVSLTPGIIAVRADQPGNSDYLPAGSIVREIEVLPSAPALSYRLADSRLTLSWPSGYDEFMLQQTDSANGPWALSSVKSSVVGDSATVEVDLAGEARFFRLVIPGAQKTTVGASQKTEIRREINP